MLDLLNEPLCSNVKNSNICHSYESLKHVGGHMSIRVMISELPMKNHPGCFNECRRLFLVE